MTKKSNNSKKKWLSLEEIFDLPSSLEEFQKEVESQHSESSETTEAKEEEQPEDMETFEVRFVNLPKKRSKK